MTREIIIEGQHVDIAPDTDITLEYVNNLVGDIGKINLSRSYTIKLPKTARNRRILDDPETPSHASSQTRRFLTAKYIRNGISLIGDAQAYILRVTPEAFEIALVWNTLEELQILSESTASLNDLPDLPVLTWLANSTGTLPDYDINGQNGAVFAWYESGLGSYLYSQQNASTHPSFYLQNLIERILKTAGVSYTFSDAAAAALSRKAVLAAPGRKPNREMERASGSQQFRTVGLLEYYSESSPYRNSLLYEYYTPEGSAQAVWSSGWDATWIQYVSLVDLFLTGGNNNHRILVNLLVPGGYDFSGGYIRVMGANTNSASLITEEEEITRFYFEQNASGRWYVFGDREINASGWKGYYLDLRGIQYPFESDTHYPLYFSAYHSGLPMVASNRVHDKIDPTKDNRFPIQGNLPDLTQWELITASLAMFGLVPVITQQSLYFYTYDEILVSGRAYDWSDKVDHSDGALPGDLSVTIPNRAQHNYITFEEDDSSEELRIDPTADIVVEDSTLKPSANLFELPFAASVQSRALHYSVKNEAIEDIDIEPRIFEVQEGDKGATLMFTDSMHGQGLVDASYSKFQEFMRKPVILELNIRLSELDLAQLDIKRSVYLAQFGKYHKILKIQTSDTDLCKVELLQLP